MKYLSFLWSASGLQRWLYAALAAAVFSAGTFALGYQKGGAAKSAAYAVAELARAKEVRAREQALQYKMDALSQESVRETAKAERLAKDYRAAVRSGAIRLSVPVARSLPGDSAVAPAPAETRAELDPAAAERIVAIGNDGDAATRELNLCIDLYNEARNNLK